MEVINAGMRKGIKIMCVVAQTAQFVSLMPKPQDFVTRIVGDVVYLSSLIQKLSDDMNKLLDSYAEIPGNYLMTQMNSITGSLSNITNRVNTFAQSGIDQIMGLGENTLGMVSELTGTVIDAAGSATKAVVGLGSAVAETSTNILGNTDVAEGIHDSVEVVLEWTGNNFQEFTTNATEPLNKATQTITDAKAKVSGTVNKAADYANDKIQQVQKFVENIIKDLREKMQKLSDIMDSGFKDVTGLDSVSKGSQKISEELKVDTENGVTTKVVEITTSVTSSLASVIKNFNIGKVVFAFTGVLAQSVIVKLGLDQLPPIDFESMLCKIRDDMTMSAQDLYKQYNLMMENTYNEYLEFGDDAAKIPSEDRNYSTKNYEDFLNQFSEEQKKQRDWIRLQMKSNYDDRGKPIDNAQDTINKREIKSAIKELRKYRKTVKNAKQTTKILDVIKEELARFKQEAEYRCSSIKADWQSMMDQYKKAIAEIKSFFQNGGSCDMFIDDTCDDINKACDEIKELCKGLVSQLIGCSLKVCMPADIGTVVPNPVYKIADFWMDIKTIFKFIKDLITLIMRIINDINKLARLMLNGLNSLKEIISQLMELIGLKWLMDLIQSIITLFGENITNARESLINTLSPVHFSDTEEYDNALEALENILGNKRVGTTDKEFLSSAAELLGTVNSKKIDEVIKNIGNVKGYGTINTDENGELTSKGKEKTEKIEELIDQLDDYGDTVIAYKSPIIEEVGDAPNVSDLMNGGTLDNDIKFIGWHFFHPNLNHTGTKYYGDGLISGIIKKIKSKIVKKASKTGSKKRGGINGMKSVNQGGVGRWMVKSDSAYTAFYWYTYYTEDLEKDCFERTTVDNTRIIDNVVSTENGSIVEITDANGNKRKVFVADNMVRQGDYVTVDGVKYRVS